MTGMFKVAVSLRETWEMSLSKARHDLHAKYKYETGKGTLRNYVM